MESIELRQLKNDILTFAKDKYVKLDKISMKEYLSTLDLWINKLDEDEKHDYYSSLFRRKPCLKTATLVEYYKEMLYIEDTVHKALQDYPNFDGIDFCDVSAGGIQIRGHHKQITGYTYGSQITIDYEFNNYINCIRMFVEMWKEIDVPEKVKRYNDFLDQGNKYGWD